MRDVKTLKHCFSVYLTFKIRKITADLQKYRYKIVHKKKKKYQKKALMMCLDKELQGGNRVCIAPINKKKRIQFARKYLHASSDFGKQVIFLDEFLSLIF